MHRFALLLLTLTACYTDEERIKGCRLRFQAAKTAMDSVIVLERKPFCVALLPPSSQTNPHAERTTP